MLTAWISLFLLAATPVAVQVKLLSGETETGELTALGPKQLQLATPGGSREVPAENLLELTVPSATAQPVGPITCRLVDGTRLQVDTYQVSADRVTLGHAQLGEMTAARKAVFSVRFAPPDPKVDTAWNQLQDRKSRQDLLTLRKGDVLDHLDGVLGQVDPTTARFLLDGDEVNVKRERIFGLIYSQTSAAPLPSAAAQVELATGELLMARTLSADQQQLAVQLSSGPMIKVAWSLVRRIDFSAGKVLYLSSVEPRSVKYTPLLDLNWEYAKDRNLEGRPLTLGRLLYARGLAIHSRTQLVYRLGGEYARFQALTGIDDEIRRDGLCTLEVKGDGRTLLTQAYAPGEPPRPLDIDVRNVLELELTVDFGQDGLDLGDRLHLVEARVIKAGANP